MKKFVVFVLVCLNLLLIGCCSKNILFKDDIYTIIYKDNNVLVSINNGATAPAVHNEAKKYINDLKLPCLYVLGYEDDTLTVTSHDYDGDAKDEFNQWKLATADNVEFLSVYVVDDNGKVTVDNITIPKDEYQYIGEYYTGGYFEFDCTGKVARVIFYGDTIIQG